MKARSGFTLVEALLAGVMAVLIVAIVSRLADGVMGLSRIAMARSEADREAQLVFERMALDLSRLLPRSDLDFLFEKSPGNDSLSFYTELAGFSADDTHPQLSVVDYKIDNLRQVDRGLLRGVQNRDWIQIVFATESQAFGSGGGLPAVDPANHQSVGSTVFRLEFWFLLRDGSFSSSWRNLARQSQMSAASPPTAEDGSNRGYAPGSWWVQNGVAEYLCTDDRPGGAQWQPCSKIGNIAAVVVAIALLDRCSQGLLPKRDGVPDLELLAQMFPDPEEGQEATPLWRAALEQEPPAGIPPAAARGVRFYENTFLLPP